MTAVKNRIDCRFTLTAGWSRPNVFSLMPKASFSRLAASLYLPWSLKMKQCTNLRRYKSTTRLSNSNSSDCKWRGQKICLLRTPHTEIQEIKGFSFLSYVHCETFETHFGTRFNSTGTQDFEGHFSIGIKVPPVSKISLHGLQSDVLLLQSEQRN